jgi:hypothetical protein
VTFGKLECVDVRACWSDEARDFTPWLATAEGIALLSESVGMELIVENTEISVGPYAADILARDLTTDAYVVIENQLEKTDHDHFGKALTYAAVLGASTVIWIAKRFTEEHRKAIEWLNELTKAGLAVYGVELQVWRTGSSEPAPRFDVVCSPNEIVRQAQEARDKPERSETRELQFAFWTDVRRVLEKSGRFRSLMSPRPQYWFNIALGRAGAKISAVANTFDKKVGVRVYLGSSVADRALEQLLPMRTEIESEIGQPLEWNPHPEKKDKIIALWHPGDIGDKDQWENLVGWVAEYVGKFYRAFGARFAKIYLSPISTSDAQGTEALAASTGE